MNKTLIYKYINNIKKEDIKNYSISKNINLTNNEIDIIYNYLKNNTTEVLDNPLQVINNIKDKLSISTYQKLLELYDNYIN